MWKTLQRFFGRSRGEGFDTPLSAGDVTMQFNHWTRIVLLYDPDPDMPENRYTEMEAHLNKQGYCLQVIVAGRSAPLPAEVYEQGLQ